MMLTERFLGRRNPRASSWHTDCSVACALYAAAERNGLVSDPKDGPRKTWATIRSGLSAGLQQPVDLDADDHPRAQPRWRTANRSWRTQGHP